MAMATSKLQGWDYIKSLMYVCPSCGEKPTLGNLFHTNEWRCACMNANCNNRNYVIHENPFMAIHEWNIKYGERPKGVRGDG